MCRIVTAKAAIYESHFAHLNSWGSRRVCGQPRWCPDQTWQQRKAETEDTTTLPAPCASTRHTSDGDREQWGQCKVSLKVRQDNSLTFSGFRSRLVAHCTLLSARTRSTSFRLCWEIFTLSSSDRQPSQDRQALSSNWDPSCTLGEKKEEPVRWRLSKRLIFLYFKRSTSVI